MKASVPRGTRMLLIASLLSVCFLDYWAYSKEYYAQPGIWMDVVRGTADAPQQYRVGVVRTAYWMSQHLHMGLRHAFTLLDIAGLLIAGLLLLRLLERSEVFQQAQRTVQWFGAAAFVLLMDFYLIWLLWYQKPETLPSTAMVALMLWLWTRRAGEPSMGKQLLMAAGLIVLAAVQGLIRADVACLLNAGIFLTTLTSIGRRLSLSRGLAVITSVVAAGVAGGVQLYMMKVVYPHATYGGLPVFELKLNLTDHLRIVPFVLFLVPIAWTYREVWKRKFAGDAAGFAFLAGATVFAALWVVIGKIDEVRIFMPFALALTPLTVQLAMLRASESENAAG